MRLHRNTKRQTPNTRQAPNTDLQPARRTVPCPLVFGAWCLFGVWGLEFGVSLSKLVQLDGKTFLLLPFFRFVLPFLDRVAVDAAQRQEFFFVVNHFLAAGAGQR